MLGRELPVAIELHQIQQLSSFFTDDVRMTVNIPNGNFKGKKWVFTAFEWNPLKQQPKVNAVIVGINAIVIVQNIPSNPRLPRGDLAPRVDIFHLNAEGKIDRIESIMGDAAIRRETRY